MPYYSVIFCFAWNIISLCFFLVNNCVKFYPYVEWWFVKAVLLNANPYVCSIVLHVTSILVLLDSSLVSREDYEDPPQKFLLS